MPDPSVLKTKNALVLKKDPVCSHTATTLDALCVICLLKKARGRRPDPCFARPHGIQHIIPCWYNFVAGEFSVSIIVL
jgi:hypothetical protein